MNKADLVREWFEIALDDFEVASHLFKTMHKKPLEIICYHCQQAVEKALKGFLTNNDIEPPHLHDLENLRLMCMEHDRSFEGIQKACVKLKEYASTTRYPDRPEIVESDAMYALKETERIYAFCADLISEFRQKQEHEQTPQQSM